jgi:menaquinone-dependent protoporphyrinogen oxidase
MNVLVLVGSKHGATREIGAAITKQLHTAGLQATTVDAENPPGDLAVYDAFVIGSALYMGHWTKDSRRFVEDHMKTLTAKPVWLFSSGPLGEVSGPGKPDPQMEEFTSVLKPFGHTIFGGALDKSDLNIAERATMRAVHAPYGDYRPWDEISTWTDEIIEALQHLDTGTKALPSP